MLIICVASPLTSLSKAHSMNHIASTSEREHKLTLGITNYGAKADYLIRVQAMLKDLILL